MSTVTDRTAPPLVLSARRITWSTVAPGFYVASTDGEFVGSIDTSPDGHFIALDGSSTPIGRYGTLREAQQSLLTTDAPGNRARKSLVRRNIRTAATASGALAGALALTAGALAPFI
ncbi:MAG: peptide ABC transporter permease [Microbacterium arborescens]